MSDRVLEVFDSMSRLDETIDYTIVPISYAHGWRRAILLALELPDEPGAHRRRHVMAVRDLGIDKRSWRYGNTLTQALKETDLSGRVIEAFTEGLPKVGETYRVTAMHPSQWPKLLVISKESGYRFLGTETWALDG